MNAQQTIADLITEHGLEETLQAFADAVVRSNEDDNTEISLALVEIMEDFFPADDDDDSEELEDDED